MIYEQKCIVLGYNLSEFRLAIKRAVTQEAEGRRSTNQGCGAEQLIPAYDDVT